MVSWTLVDEPTRQVAHERVRRFRVAPSEMPGNDQLAVCINRRPRPNISIAKLTALILGTLFCLE